MSGAGYGAGVESDALRDALPECEMCGQEKAILSHPTRTEVYGTVVCGLLVCRGCSTK